MKCENISILVLILLVFIGTLHSQSVEFIKSATSKYYWGEGEGRTIDEADKRAMAMLSEQICVQVEKQFISVDNETEQDLKEHVEVSIKTYSNVTFHGDSKAERRIINNTPPKCKVFRFIEIEQANKIFGARKQKAIDYAMGGAELMDKLQIADALRYLYWAHVMLSTVPNFHQIKHEQSGKPLYLWIDMQIKDILLGINITIKDVVRESGINKYVLSIKHKNDDAANFDYTYWTGDDYSEHTSSRNGIGIVCLTGGYMLNYIDVKAEYYLTSSVNVDPETKNVIESVGGSVYGVRDIFRVDIPANFRGTVNAESNSVAKMDVIKDEQVVNREAKKAASILKVDTQCEKRCADVMKSVESSIRNKRYDDVKDFFTADGFDIFNKLIKYGNATVLGSIGDYKFIGFNNMVMCRSLSMSFQFKTNRHTFIEEVIFSFDSSNRIDNVQFAVSKATVDDVLEKNQGRWNDEVSMMIIDFLENYKTAYSLKRLDYIQNVFANDALIITGKVLKPAPQIESLAKDYQQIRYDTMTKGAYIKRMERVFNSNEYVNILFTQNDIKHLSKYGNTFGIKIKQEYFSSNYGDVGYLFLIVDLNDINAPIIRVRTWQPISTDKYDIIDDSFFK